MAFVHLHTHSHYSLLKALPQISPLVKAIKAHGMNAVALTDLGALYGAIEFYETCLKEGVKPIIGCEVFVVRDRFDKSGDQPKPYHLVVLAEHYEGYKNLMKLVSAGALDGFHDGMPRVDKNLLAEYHEGLIALSGCKQGELAQIILSGDEARAQAVAQEYSKIFGKDNFYLELQDHPDVQGQFQINEGLQKIAAATGLPLVVTRDVHYLEEGDADACEISECIGLGKTIHDHRNESLVDVDRSLSTPEQIESRWRHVPEALANTVKIAARINIEIKLNVWHFPPIEKPADKTYDEVLRENTYAGIAQLLPDMTAEIRERLEYELGVIEKKGYAPYFLAVADYIQWARSQGIVTTTRGSAAGSLVSYAIGIVGVNPLYFKLPFERFLNPFRPSPPDVDGDFADDRREEVIAYVTKKYGKDKVAQIVTFGTMAARASIRDAGRALGLSYGFCDRISKLVPFGAQGMPMTIDKALVESPDLKKIYDEQEEVQRLLNIARKIEGNARHTSIHAAGVVISPQPLTDFTPVQYEVGGTHLTTQYEMHAVEAAGVLKMDFLGIRNLSILGNAIKLIEARYGVNIDLQKISWDDKKTYEMLARGETGGVFQLSGGGMTRYLKELKPSSMFDIMAMVALFRPGPMESIPEYIRRKHNPTLVTYLDDRLKNILDQSLGILVYQDDVLLTAIELAGYNWEEADKFRKAMGKKIPEEMARQKEKFFNGCIVHGMPFEKVEILWQLIEPFAAYGFNKAHAASYAVVAYQTAYLKANYPAAYMCSVLSAESDDLDKLTDIVHECERMNIEVLPPHVNESFEKFSVQTDDAGKEYIRFGLSAIKNVGAHITEVIIRERTAGGTFTTLANFLERVQDKDLNKKSVESLIKCGAFDVWGDRGVLLANVERMLSFTREFVSLKESNQGSLFGALGGAVSLQLSAAPDAELTDKLQWEKELIGLYISAHPFEKFAEPMRGMYTELAHVETEKPGSYVVLCGLITEAKKKWTKNREPMMNVKAEDMSASVELLVFPKTFAKTETVWAVGTCAWMIGRKSQESGDSKIFIENAGVLDETKIQEIKKQLQEEIARQKNRSQYAHKFAAKKIDAAAAASTTTPTPQQQPPSRLVLTMPQDFSPESLTSLQKTLAGNPGATRVLISVQHDGRPTLIETDRSVMCTERFVSSLKELLGADNVRMTS